MWLFMSLDDGSWSGKATCQVRLAGGKTVLLGTFWLDNGYGAWGVSLAPGTARIRSASVLSNGGVLASADFAPGPTAYLSGTTAQVQAAGR
jgi:glycine/D-amino acid oxidase-like deaminating enzyme